MFTFPPRDEYREPGISPSYYEDDPILLASMGDKRIKEAKNLPRCSIPHRGRVPGTGDFPQLL